MGDVTVGLHWIWDYWHSCPVTGLVKLYVLRHTDVNSNNSLVCFVKHESAGSVAEVGAVWTFGHHVLCSLIAAGKTHSLRGLQHAFTSAYRDCVWFSWRPVFKTGEQNWWSIDPWKQSPISVTEGVFLFWNSPRSFFTVYWLIAHLCCCWGCVSVAAGRWNWSTKEASCAHICQELSQAKMDWLCVCTCCCPQVCASPKLQRQTLLQT